MTLRADDFWQFSCQHYMKEGVAKSCLTLQDNFGCNVNLLLLCVFLEQANKGLSIEQCAYLHRAIEHDDNTLKAHREIRKAAKHGNQSNYNSLKQQELALERAQQENLIAAFNGMPKAQKSYDPIDTFLAYYDLDENSKNTLVLPVKA
ncbi:TIGR02444 family protein [Alteromonas sediminis]|uniref:TIGR02444 family protein n=1 Tax=Alteromonas sediminis TaxID=2259342 RepID=A0A3N5ZAT9_9ALTE|nr:TIGR02444 family protein [Alteromonas sediminis]RPJ66678.1 TIGR02444 family protein [Alteromonas sediminis]